MPGAHARHRATPPPSLLAWSLLVALERRTKPRSPHVPSHSPPILPLLCLSLSFSRPNATDATARRSRSHRAPRDHLSSPRAPPPRPEAPRRATHLRTASITAIAIVFLLGLRRPPPSIRRHQVSPDPAVLLCVIPVSLCFEPLSYPSRLRRLGLSSAMAEARLRSSLSPALLRRPVGHASAPSTLAAPRSAPLAF